MGDKNMKIRFITVMLLLTEKLRFLRFRINQHYLWDTGFPRK